MDRRHGTTPSHRRRGLGEEALVSAIRATAQGRGCVEIGLEVLEGNKPAIQLYTKLGFEIVRDLERLVPARRPAGGPTLRPKPWNRQRATMDRSAPRESPEPWQRADETLAALESRGAHLGGLVSKRDDEILAAAVIHRGRKPSPSYRSPLRTKTRRGNSYWLQHGAASHCGSRSVPIDEPAARGNQAARAAGHVANQHEMALRSLVDPRLEP